MTEHYTQQHANQAKNLPGNSIEWINKYRNDSLSRFKEVGFPSLRDEDWRYTTLKPITSKQFRATTPFADESAANNESAVDLEPFSIAQFDTHRLVFIDGVFSPTKSTIGTLCDGLTIDSLANVLNQRPESIHRYMDSVLGEEKHGFTALNNAYSCDGVVIELAVDCQLDKPIELLFVGCGGEALAQPRNLVIAQQGSKGAIIERYVSAQSGPGLSNSVTEVILEEQAEVDYYLVQTQSKEAYQVCGVWAKQARESRFSCRTITLGGSLVRNELRTHLMGEGAHCDMFGLYSLAGRQHVDNHTTMIHDAENCTSNELYKGVLNQRSRGVFHGRIKVEPDAQQTDAKQSNNTLLLSRDAEIDTKPQLEIYADDVKCSHGATVGQMDEASLFYLRSRGIDEADARSLLTFAFVNDVLLEVDIEPLKTALELVLAEQLINDR